jgi:hypothetical protein
MISRACWSCRPAVPFTELPNSSRPPWLIFLWGRVFDGIRPRAWSVGLERRQRFGILLDVVGDPGREGFRAANTDLGSVSAPLEHRVEKVWQQGAL